MRIMGGLVALRNPEEILTTGGSIAVEGWSLHGYSFLGSSFAYMSSRVFLTAAHCVMAAGGSQIGVFVPEPRGLTITAADDVVVHPEADLAIVRVADAPPPDPLFQITEHELGPFRGNLAAAAPGTDYVAYGFPEDVFDRSARLRSPTVVARTFKGYFQRFLQHRSHLGYAYEAGELSTPCPAGLSGGLLYPADHPGLLFGMVTENLESYTTLEEIEERTKAGEVARIENRRVITYGIALMLEPVHTWIHEQLEERGWY